MAVHVASMLEEGDGAEPGEPEMADLYAASIAGVSIRADDRKGLERLVRYASPPPIAADRLEQLPDGRLSYRLKTPRKNRTTHVIFEPPEFLTRLAVLIPAS